MCVWGGAVLKEVHLLGPGELTGVIGKKPYLRESHGDPPPPEW